MSRNSRLALAAILLAAACNASPRNWDGIEPTAGMAQTINLAVHTADVTSATVRRPNPGGSGKAAALTMERFRSPPGPKPATLAE